jgi:hypothetical protein
MASASLKGAKPKRAAKAGSRSKMAKITVTIPAEILEAALAQVHAGQASSLSAYVARAVAKQVSVDEEGDAYLKLLDRLDQELGPPSEAHYEWARQFVGR